MNDREVYQRDWVAFLAAVVLLYTALKAIRTGEITPLLYRTFRRVENRFSFWISVGIYGIGAVVSLLSIIIPRG